MVSRGNYKLIWYSVAACTHRDLLQHLQAIWNMIHYPLPDKLLSTSYKSNNSCFAQSSTMGCTSNRKWEVIRLPKVMFGSLSVLAGKEKLNQQQNPSIPNNKNRSAPGNPHNEFLDRQCSGKVVFLSFQQEDMSGWSWLFCVSAAAWLVPERVSGGPWTIPSHLMLCFQFFLLPFLPGFLDRSC